MKRFLYVLACVFASLSVHSEVKYVFYLIGDGMGQNEILAAEMYLAELDSVIGRRPLHITGLPYTGTVATHSVSNGITDSSAAGTALATGVKTNNGTLGLSAEGDTLVTIAKQLKAQGWGVGLLTTVAIDHATPAAFYANVKNRDSYYEVGKQLVRTNFDFFGGAGLHRPVPPEGQTGPNVYDLAEENGYTLARGLKDAQLKRDAKKLILQQHHERFFLMIEGGMLDYAGHGRDGATDILEMLDFDNAVGAVMDFYRQHPEETLVVVTADHETGGLALGNSDYTLNLQILRHQHCSSWVLSDQINALFKKGQPRPKWQDIQAILERQLDFYGEVEISDKEDRMLKDAFKQAMKSKSQRSFRTMYKDLNKLCNTAIGILNYKAKLGWTNYGHTGAAVPVFAIDRSGCRAVHRLDG